MKFHWFEHFKNGFIECSKQLNLNKAEICLFNMNVEAKRILGEVKKLLEPAINITKVLKQMNKEDLVWYFKKDEEKVYYSNELDRVTDIEKRFIEEQLGEEKVKEIYDFARSCGVNHEWKNDSLKISRILRYELLKKLMRDYLDEEHNCKYRKELKELENAMVFGFDIPDSWIIKDDEDEK